MVEIGRFRVVLSSVRWPCAVGVLPNVIEGLVVMISFRSRRFPSVVLPMWMKFSVRIWAGVKGLPVLSVMSVLIVVPGFNGSSVPMMMSAFVFVVGVRRRVVSRVAEVRDFSLVEAGLWLFVGLYILLLSAGGSVVVVNW